MGNLFSVSISTDSVASCCWNCGKQALHGCALGENIHHLKDDWDELKRMRNDLLRRVVYEEGPRMKRLDQVEGWLLKVDGMEDDVKKLMINGNREIEMTCLSGCCPKNCKARYKSGKKVAQKLKEVADLRRKGHFDSVVGRLASPPVEARHSEPTIGMKSMIGEVWEYIGDDRVGVIGLYGMGGVGKTTLLTEINNKFSNTSHDFNVVIWVEVSKNVGKQKPNSDSIEKVQEEIGKKIGYSDNMWANKSQIQKAEDIFKVLREKKFVLLLDDIWERIDLKQVGVPFPNEENKCKIVFTTRSEDVCGHMEAQKEVKVNCLAPDEAWDLFKMKVREDTLSADPEIPKLAKLMAQKCAGLPLALITIGRGMASKRTPQEWSHSVRKLEENIAMFSGMEDEVFAILKFSYDVLRKEKVQSCFLYCSLFPEDYYIPKKKIIGYWFGEGFLNEYDMLLGYAIIGILVRACLLEEDGNDSIKMHDLIRGMALWIACGCGMERGKHLVRARAGLTRALDIGEWNRAERLSLASNHIEKLPEAPSCPNLLTLFLNDNHLKMISSDFFRSMRALTVLDLSHNEGLIELPNSIDCLVSLQYLNLSGTSITELPIELGNLVRLKYLDMTNTSSLNNIPDGILLCFIKLQVLKMFGCGLSDESRELDISFSALETCLIELKEISFTVKSPSALRAYSSFAMLFICTTRLGCSHFCGTSILDLSFLERMVSLNRLEITYCEELQQVKCESYTRLLTGISSPNYFHSLRSVFVVRCPMISELTILSFAPNLELVLIAYCYGIEEIIDENSGVAWEIFSKLKELYLIELPKLRSISANVLPFPCLKFIRVEGCPMLKELSLDSQTAKECGLTIQGDEDLKVKVEASFCLFDESEENKKKGESSSSSSSGKKKGESSSSSSSGKKKGESFCFISSGKKKGESSSSSSNGQKKGESSSSSSSGEKKGESFSFISSRKKKGESSSSSSSGKKKGESFSFISSGKKKGESSSSTADAYLPYFKSFD